MFPHDELITTVLNMNKLFQAAIHMSHGRPYKSLTVPVPAACSEVVLVNCCNMWLQQWLTSNSYLTHCHHPQNVTLNTISKELPAHPHLLCCLCWATQLNCINFLTRESPRPLTMFFANTNNISLQIKQSTANPCNMLPLAVVLCFLWFYMELLQFIKLCLLGMCHCIQ